MSESHFVTLTCFLFLFFSFVFSSSAVTSKSTNNRRHTKKIHNFVNSLHCSWCSATPNDVLTGESLGCQDFDMNQNNTGNLPVHITETPPKKTETPRFEGVTAAELVAEAYNYLSVISVFLAGSAASIIFALPSPDDLENKTCQYNLSDLVTLWCYVVFTHLLSLSIITTQQYFLQVKDAHERYLFSIHPISVFSRHAAVGFTLVGLILFLVALFLSTIYRLPGCSLNHSIIVGGIGFCILIIIPILGMFLASRNKSIVDPINDNNTQDLIGRHETEKNSHALQ
jgi:hypothetical protein